MKKRKKIKFRIDYYEDREMVITGLTNAGYFCKVNKVRENFVDKYFVDVLKRSKRSEEETN